MPPRPPHACIVGGEGKFSKMWIRVGLDVNMINSSGSMVFTQPHRLWNDSWF